MNIALVNELAILADRMGIDVWESIGAASTKPFGFMPFWPGPGLGGHCIPVDPFYLAWRAKAFDMDFEFVELRRAHQREHAVLRGEPDRAGAQSRSEAAARLANPAARRGLQAGRRRHCARARR